MSSMLYQATVPVFERALGALEAILVKASAYAAERKIDPAVLLAARLRADMLPLVRQTLIACDHAKFMAARLARVEAPKFDDTETTFEEIGARIRKTLEFVRGVSPEAIEAGATREVVFPLGPTRMKMKGADYVFHFAMPNFYFHLTTAYDILRFNGVEIGKRDFLGAVQGIAPA